jgi:hypothetical protein
VSQEEVGKREKEEQKSNIGCFIKTAKKCKRLELNSIMEIVGTSVQHVVKAMELKFLYPHCLRIAPTGQ